MRDDDYQASLAVAKTMLAAAEPMEDVLAYLRVCGLSWLYSVKALRDATGMSLDEAKLAVARSATWADYNPGRERLERAIDEFLKTERE